MEKHYPDMKFIFQKFTVEDCDSPEQAEEEVDKWIKSFLDDMAEERGANVVTAPTPSPVITKRDDAISGETKTVQNPKVSVPF